MISAAGVYALQLGVESRSQLRDADERIREIEVFRLVLKEDLSLLAPRIAKNEYGEPAPAAFVGGRGFATRAPVDGETPLMGFVRRNWDNPDGAAPRSTLQYVEYIIKGDDLVRRVRPYLDDARGQPKTDRVVLSSAPALKVSFFETENSAGLQWVEIWPLTRGGQSTFAPRAVRVEWESPRFGALEQMFWVGASE